MAAITKLISGERARRTSEALTRLLEHSREMNARIAQEGQSLAGVRDLSRRVRLAFAGLRNTVAVFRTLCTQTRIETSRLGSAGADFGDLADEVRPLSESIQSSGEGLLEAASRLDRSVDSAIRSGSELRDTQLKELPSLIASVISSLQSFEERRQRAHEASVRQAEQNEAVCEAIDDLVKSIQFHDITRQQIEHVMLALGQVRSECQAPGGKWSSPPPGAQAVLTLQCAQLSSAERVFSSSIKRMECDLEGIAVRVRDMAEASRALMGISGDEQESFFLQMEGCLTAILKGVSTCSAAESEIRARAHGLEQTIARMAESVQEIRGIELQIRRIAINATIRAAHIGAAGNALDVIAEVMHRIALDSTRNTEDAAAALDSMTDATNRVRGGSGSTASDGSSDTADIVGQMRSTILELHSSSESSFSRVNQIAALGSQLVDDLDSVRSGFSAGPLFAEVVTRSRKELERIAAEAGPSFLGNHVEVTPTRCLEDLATQYTMQMERDVHESVTRDAPIPSSALRESSRVSLDDEDFGDNVELF